MGSSCLEGLPIWVKVTICICVWWSCAIAVTLGVKAVLGKSSLAGHKAALYPFPFALTALMNASVALIAGCIEFLRFTCIRNADATKLGKTFAPARLSDAAKLLAIGFFQGLEIGCVNKSLEFLSVAKRTMVKSTSLLFVMMVAVPFGLEELSCGKVVAAGLLTIGGCFQGLSTWRHRSTVNVDMIEAGYMMAVASMVLSSCRWALLQHLLQRSKPDSYLRQMTKLQMLSCIMPVNSLVCSVLAGVFEYDAFDSVSQHVIWRCFLLASTLTVMVASELFFVEMTSAVAMNVAGQLHNIPIALGGVFFFNENIHPFAAAGFLFCVFGALLYTTERQEARAAARSVERVDQEDNAMVDFAETIPGRVPAGSPTESDEPGVRIGSLQVHVSDSRKGHEPKPAVYGVPAS